MVTKGKKPKPKDSETDRISPTFSTGQLQEIDKLCGTVYGKNPTEVVKNIVINHLIEKRSPQKNSDKA